MLRARGSSRRGADERVVDDVVSRLYAPGFWIWLHRKVPPALMRERLLATDMTERAIFATLIELYRERGCANNSGTDVIEGEKTPQHLYNVPTLDEWFPGCKIVHTFRDPRGIYASQLKQIQRSRWGPKEALARFLPERAADLLLAPYQLVHTTLAWRDAVKLHFKYRKLMGDRYILVRFEDLVTQPETELRRLCTFLGVPFQPTMLEGVDVVGSGYHDERHVGLGIDPSAADRWRSHVRPVVNTWFSLAFGRALQALGYPRS